ncbi:MAG: bacterial Ig-like domain-containing protein [Treponema sp.]|nr:bacterial Ig-like domain-containing protein [Candidatus Treponema merdequi]
MRKVLGIGAAILCSLVVLFTGCPAASTPSPVLYKIEITNEPNKKEYFVGAAQLDLTGLKVTATYTDGSIADVTDKVTTSGFDSSTATESQTITVTYEGKTATFDVKITSVLLTGIEITNPPNKKEYFVGAAQLDLSGMVVTATYNNGSTKDVTNDAETSGFDSSAATESQTIIVTYGEKTATFDVKITSVLLTGIEITNPPNKKEYFVGAVQLDLAGMVVTATYTDGSTADVTDKVTTSGFDSSTATESQTITVTYEGKTATFIVKIKPILTKIEITNEPKKNEYFVGEELDTAGIKVTATLSDSTEKDVTADVKLSGYDKAKAGEQTVTVSYTQNEITKTAEFKVTVKAVEVTKIEITKEPTKKEYFTGATALDLTCMVVTATYNNGTTKDVTTNVTTSGFNSSAATESQTITVTYEGKTATFTVKIKQGYTFHNTVTTLESGTGSYGTDATYVEFGDWPQEVVPVNDVTTLGLETSKDKVTRGYMEFVHGLDGNYYVKCAENACGSGYKYKNDSTLVGQNKTTSRWFKVMPIKWRVADNEYDIDGDTGTATGKLLVAESILTANVPYYEDMDKNRTIDSKTVYPNNYMHSQIRAYLNGISYNAANESYEGKWLDKGFLQTAFTSDAIDKIITTKVNNAKEQMSYDGTHDMKEEYACDPTDDKIFLLSEREVVKYSKEAYSSCGKGNSRIRGTTDFAKANNAFQDANDGYGGYWRLRSPYYNYSIDALGVFSDGEANFLSTVIDTRYGVVPALSISF